MTNTYIIFFAEQTPSSVLIFIVSWITIGKLTKSKIKFKKNMFYLILGIILTIIISGLIRIFSLFVLDPRQVISPTDGLNVFYSIVLPLIVSSTITKVLRKRNVTNKHLIG